MLQLKQLLHTEEQPLTPNEFWILFSGMDGQPCRKQEFPERNISCYDFNNGDHESFSFVVEQKKDGVHYSLLHAKYGKVYHQPSLIPKLP